MQLDLEYYNPTGSYKDRMALAMIEGAEARGTLRPGMRVVEYTGGSTGSSLTLVCAIKGYKFVPVSSDGFAKEKLQMMRVFGADLRIIPAENGQLTPELFRTMVDTAKQLSHEPNTYWTDQFNNTNAIRGYMENRTSCSIRPARTLPPFVAEWELRGCWSGCHER